ncbi:putative pho85 cyclin-1 [Rosellinia necatrix]|uniref:Putative pho85 cyclin-1 n=1 Tax=Rosellinia necatrix TaxID=77044 RepID=A0A1W2TM60_ROSNE|nr:putative pho85 cyclin-1 [Rosellinia necatrix]
MSSGSIIRMDELNAAALDQFIHSHVSHAMICHLAEAASKVIQCDPNMMPPPPQYEARYPTPPRTPSPQAIRCDDSGLPTLEEFITQLVLSSNVMVPTLMSTLVYLTRLKSRLQPMAKGLRCTTHRIFLAALILSAKYLNDSSPKNKHWANYSNIRCDGYSFGFSRTEVNLMEKQLLFLLDWDLRITEEDLYREFDIFLAPIRDDIEAKYARRMQRKKQRQAEAAARAWPTVQVPTPPASRGSSRSRSQQRLPSPPKESSIRMVREAVSESTPPPELAHSYSSSASSSSGSSYASSLSSRQHSRSSTPLSDPEADPYINYMDGSLYESPIEIVVDMPQPAMARKHKNAYRGKQMLPYEISADELCELQYGGASAKRARTGRGMWQRMFGAQA